MTRHERERDQTAFISVSWAEGGKKEWDRLIIGDGTRKKKRSERLDRKRRTDGQEERKQ